MKSALSLLDIINDILDFSKIEAEKITLESIPVNIQEVINDIGDLTTLKAEDKGIDLIVYTDNNLPKTVLADPVRLRQIIINLVNNAIKFTDEGEVFIQANVIDMDENRVKVKFSVKDNGIGISEDIKKRLFKPFTQADNTITRRYGGTGLGLSISSKLCKVMGGEIEVESEIGKGSDFYFTLEFDIHKSEITENENMDLSIYKILVIDDNDHNLLIFKKYFEFWNCKIETASSPNQAIKLLSTKTSENFFDLIITDYNMPEMNGKELMKRIKRLYPAQKFKTILASSVTSLLSSDSGFDHLYNFKLTKPIKRSRLLDALNFCLFNNTSNNTANNCYNERHSKQLRNILLVEDNLINQKIGTLVLQKGNNKCTVANNGLDALEILKSHHFDIIFMDLHMPLMDGFECTKSIRKQEKENSAKPQIIIALTANALKEIHDDIHNLGFDDIVTKPFTQENLFEMVDKYCNES